MVFFGFNIMEIKTKLTNIETGLIIYLSNNLFPVDEHNWSKIASNVTYTLNGGMIVQQNEKKSGQPYTLKSTPNAGWITLDTVNKLKLERDKLSAKFWLDYLGNGGIERVKVIFDTTKEDAINATPVEDSVSPELDDKYLITLKFIEVE